MLKSVTESQNNITNSLTCTEKYQSFYYKLQFNTPLHLSFLSHQTA